MSIDQMCDRHALKKPHPACLKKFPRSKMFDQSTKFPLDRCSDIGFRSVEGAEIWVNDLYDDNNQMMFKHKTDYQRVVEI
jgi:hypothetical protein